jgi:hypothetical protein
MDGLGSVVGRAQGLQKLYFCVINKAELRTNSREKYIYTYRKFVLNILVQYTTTLLYGIMKGTRLIDVEYCPGAAQLDSRSYLVVAQAKS